MPEQPPKTPAHASDDELLASAIPIDDSEDQDDQVSLGSDEDDLSPIEMSEATNNSGKSMIQMFGPERKPHDEHWNRTPNITGRGAIHVKTFVAKLRLDAIDHLDEQVNQWLDNHPEYEVKFVTTTVGKLIGKIPEQAIFMNVWV